MKRSRRWALGTVLVMAAACLIVPAVVTAGPDDSAAVRFGNPEAGSPYQPPEFFHDWRFLFVGVRWWFAKVRGKERA